MCIVERIIEVPFQRHAIHFDRTRHSSCKLMWLKSHLEKYEHLENFTIAQTASKVLAFLCLGCPNQRTMTQSNKVVQRIFEFIYSLHNNSSFVCGIQMILATIGTWAMSIHRWVILSEAKRKAIHGRSTRIKLKFTQQQRTMCANGIHCIRICDNEKYQESDDDDAKANERIYK